ncbi:heavy metal translocating P-type ATPase [Corynebacterium halotolerans]|uniref:Cation-transporting P-type ATPase n=1 Tax=Corynebacterium halotolerans YIM 70093 = DSM 44683 TaxID=1121362 RepID=M1NJ42_9CORY|nr:HAD family hydrolase [Corynebacterium halotolerans]AGF71428.1 cation-transporting P-type ATPase [Corynebacterium halotolerans YIM 70093 = DSM 44683]
MAHDEEPAVRGLDDEVTSAITEARTAARAAGFNDSRADTTEEDPEAELTERPKVSYAFDLEGLHNAPEVVDIEASLEAVPGVRARIVYPSATAWVTAPDTVDPDALAGIIAGFGVTAVLTDSSLRRRALRPHLNETVNLRAERRRHPRYRGLPWKFRRHLADEARNLEKARRAGFLDAPAERARDVEQAGPRDVLFTARDLLTTRRLIVSALLSIPVLVLSYVQAWQFDGWQWLTLALSAPVVTWGAWPFHRALVGGIRRGLTALDAASAMAIISAVLWSLVMLLFTPAGELGWDSSPQWFAFNHVRISQGELFLDVACGMTVLLLAGRLLTMRNRAGLLEEMDARRPAPNHPVLISFRNRATGRTSTERIPLQEVNVGDDIIIEAGEVVPVDGRVVGGSCRITQGLIGTAGDAAAGVEEVKVNSFVYAGTETLDGRIKVRVVRTGHRTRMAAIHRWVTEAIRQQNRSALLSTRTAAVLIPVALGLAAVDFALWALIAGNFNAAFATALAVLACVAPVAIALSPALAIRHGIEASARNGILVRDGVTIRRLEMVDTVIFNRVGTLAEPVMSVETVTADRGENADLVLRVAGALALESDHPVSQALVRAAREARDAGAGGEEVPHWINVTHSEINDDGDFTGLIELPVVDSDGTVHNRQVEAVLWRPNNMSELRGRLAAAAVSGGTPLVVRWKGRDRGVITLHDTVKNDAEEAVGQLEGMGVETMMLSRDAYPVARRFADRLGIFRVLAGIEPGRKPRTVRAVHARGASVAMVGDASVMETLRVADVGILMGGAETRDRIGRAEQPDVDVIILRRDVSAIPQLITLSRRICRIIDRNIIFAWTYNGLAVLASVAGVLHPMAATVLMLGSSLFIEARSNSARVFPR